MHHSVAPSVSIVNTCVIKRQDAPGLDFPNPNSSVVFKPVSACHLWVFSVPASHGVLGVMHLAAWLPRISLHKNCFINRVLNKSEVCCQIGCVLVSIYMMETLHNS